MTDSASQNAFRSALALLADDVPAPLVTDAVAAEQAWAAARRRAWSRRAARAVREHPVLAWPVLAATAAVLVTVVLLVASAVASLDLSAPSPAEPSRGPGALPQKVFVAPPWTPSVTDSPIGRAAYLVTVHARDGLLLRAMAVSADDGTYRQVPFGAGQGGVLSRDGRRLAWTEERADARPTFAVVAVLDLPTGRVRRLPVRADAAVSTSVDGLVFDRGGERLALWGSSSVDGTTGDGMLQLLDVGPLGTRTPLGVVAACYSTCFGPVAWLDDGRLAYAESGATVDDLPGVTGAAVPADPRNGFGTNLVAGLDLAVDGDGVTRYVVAREGPEGEDPDGRPYRLLAVTSRGVVTPTPLGNAMDATVLHAARSGALVELVAPAPAGRFGDGRATVVRVDPSGRRLVTSAEARVLVAQVAADVAAGGVTEARARPRFGVLSLAWWSWHASDVLVALGLAVAGGLVVGLVLRFVPARPGPVLRRLRRGSAPAS